MRSTWHLRANAVVLAWLLAAAIATVVHRWLPESEWLMVHLLMLGAVTSAILIWSAHFTQALRRRSLPSGRKGEAIRLAGHSVGAIAVVVGIGGGFPVAVIAGAVVIGVVLAWHVIEIALASRGAFANRLGWSTWAYVGASVAMMAGIVLGVLLSREVASVDGAARLYLSHVTLMIVGWVALTVMATLITLWPTVLAVRMPDESVTWGRAGLVVMGAGVLATVGLIGADARVASGLVLALVAVGIGLVGFPMVQAVRTRPPTTVAGWHLGAAVVWLAGSVLTWAVFVATADDWGQAQARMGGVVAAVIAGGAAQVLLGALSHLIPMVLGGGPHAVRSSRASIESKALARFVLVNGGVLLWVLPAPSLVRVGGSAVAAIGAVWTMAAIVKGARVSFAARKEEPQGQMPRMVAANSGGVRAPLPGKGAAVVAACAVVLTAAVAVAADPSAAGIGRDAADDVVPTGHTVEVVVETYDMRFTPGDVTLQAGDHLIIEVRNTDATVHDLVLDTGEGTRRLGPGESETLDVGIVGRDIEGWCSIAGHRQMGMEFEIIVEGGQASQAETADQALPVGDHAHGDAGVDPASASAIENLDLMADMDRPPFDATLPAASDETVHDITLAVEDVVGEVAPGATQKLWTFNEAVPAPTLRGKVGDRFEITLINNGDMGHSIDFHASQVAPDEAMRTIEPGESLTYTFVARRAGAWLYHCSTSPMSLHIANGMFGAVIIDPPDLEPVDREFALVQSEMYLGPQGEIMDSAKIADEAPDLVVFNGHATQYRQHPLEARVGERVRVWVVDAGPSRASSFHIVGGQFDTIYYEGAYQLGGPGSGAYEGGAQALALQPGQGGFVELEFPEPGNYPFVSHIMVDAERGAAGLFHVTE